MYSHKIVRELLYLLFGVAMTAALLERNDCWVHLVDHLCACYQIVVCVFGCIAYCLDLIKPILQLLNPLLDLSCCDDRLLFFRFVFFV